MKLGACLLLLADESDPLAISSIPHIREAGFDYAEVSLARCLALSDEALDTYCAFFQENELPVDVFNNAIPKDLALIGPNSNKEKIDQYIHRAIVIAQRMGCSIITMSGPNRRRAPANYPWELGFQEYVEFLQAYSSLAEEAGITLAIEPINDEEHSFISTVAEANRAAKASGCKNVKAMVDFYHFFKQKDDYQNLLQICENDIVHVHYAALPDRTYPAKKDYEACRKVLMPLMEAGYTGRISLEAFAHNHEEDLAQACALLRNL